MPRKQKYLVRRSGEKSRFSMNFFTGGDRGKNNWKGVKWQVSMMDILKPNVAKLKQSKKSNELARIRAKVQARRRSK